MRCESRQLTIRCRHGKAAQHCILHGLHTSWKKRPRLGRDQTKHITRVTAMDKQADSAAACGSIAQRLPRKSRQSMARASRNCT